LYELIQPKTSRRGETEALIGTGSIIDGTIVAADTEYSWWGIPDGKSGFSDLDSKSRLQDWRTNRWMVSTSTL